MARLLAPRVRIHLVVTAGAGCLLFSQISGIPIDIGEDRRQNLPSVEGGG
ncbi:MAG: hypothetical protein SVU88_00700 [Candidatus Nanohaloarchaea archaeon]|nr:hypothetical protein [Candidatus Nanohaloarchaea archaeon]